MKCNAIILCILTCLAVSGCQTSYTYVRNDGTTFETNKVLRPSPEYRLLPSDNNDSKISYQNASTERLFLKKTQDVDLLNAQVKARGFYNDYENQYDQIIEQMGYKYDVDPALIKAVIRVESMFQPNVTSHAGAQGLMQLMPMTAKRFGVNDSFDPVQNISGGVQYLNFLLRRFNNNLSLVLAGYNAGEGAVDRFGGIPPYDETIGYVKKVTHFYTVYSTEN